MSVLKDQPKVSGLVDEKNGIERVELEDITIQDDPQKWSRTKKTLILATISAAGMLLILANAILYPSLPAIKNAFDTTDTVANSLIGVYILSMGICPLGWAAYSDKRGTRRNVYLLSSAIFVVASAVCALSPNIWLLIIMRALQAGGASAVQSVGAGTLSDLYRVEDRGTAYGIQFAGVLLAPLTGPVIGGYIGEYLGWRWTFWFVTIIGTLLFGVMFFLPETYRKPNESEGCKIGSEEKEEERLPVTCNDVITYELEKQDDLNETRKNDDQIHIDIPLAISKASTNPSSPISPTATLVSSAPTSPTTIVPSVPTSTTDLSPSTFTFPTTLPTCSSPTFSSPPEKKHYRLSSLFLFLSPLRLLRYPNVTFVVACTSALFSAGYTQDTLISTTFQIDHYSLSPSTSGYVFLCSGFGYMIGSVFGGKYADMMLAKQAKKNNGVQYAEMRLKSVWLGAILFPISISAYGWCVEKSVFIAWPLLAMFFDGIGVFLITSSMVSYLIDAFPGLSASVMSVNICMRYLAASVMSIIAAPIKDVIGNGWLFTIMGGLAIVGVCLLTIIYFKGREWREKINMRENVKQNESKT
ncbi:4655_t:CDS:2 [Paraglomus occultum]|uniref:4655_t:CDS:1 n=1 Tax=Paraglomus occultum TaxID=144539 RepID=A0A9N9FPV6_9GLOM|nr:4655_t:CDS:2 [Paraglomus occultum]